MRDANVHVTQAVPALAKLELGTTSPRDPNARFSIVPPVPVLERRRESSLWNSERIPSERSFRRALADLFLKGDWMRLYMTYNPSPEMPGCSAERDVQAFATTQQNLSLVAALMLSVVASFLAEQVNTGDVATPPVFVFIISGFTSAIFFFVSTLMSIVLLIIMAQANTDDEARFMLLSFSKFSVRPQQAFVFGVIFAALSVFFLIFKVCLIDVCRVTNAPRAWLVCPTLDDGGNSWASRHIGITAWTSFAIMQLFSVAAGIYIIMCLVTTVQYVYQCKRAYKQLQLEMRTSGEGAATSSFMIVVGMEQMLEALQGYVAAVGIEYVDQGHWMQYLFQRFKPPLSDGDEKLGDVLCHLSMFTKQRARRLLTQLIERKLRDDVDDNPECIAGLNHILERHFDGDSGAVYKEACGQPFEVDDGTVRSIPRDARVPRVFNPKDRVSEVCSGRRSSNSSAPDTAKLNAAQQELFNSCSSSASGGGDAVDTDLVAIGGMSQMGCSRGLIASH